MKATQVQDVKVVGLLLKGRADPDQGGLFNFNASTPLFLAAELGDLEIVRLLLEAGAARDQARRDGKTPALIAAQRGHVDVARLLALKAQDFVEQAEVDAMI